ncbi:hypothetical protein TIFTF001_016076 [Ficus carica]|uniref:Uncharacterized protein n=1 Tax=Ficus carica TaxID=3494 RepID=A0AA88A5L6_FICCA|nr:hypothetical protein TIFTF001_016076 [Ficus carica]
MLRGQDQGFIAVTFVTLRSKVRLPSDLLFLPNGVPSSPAVARDGSDLLLLKCHTAGAVSIQASATPRHRSCGDLSG